MKKRILSLLLVFVMVLGLLPTAAFAEEKTYEVTIHVAPSTANAVFYAGGDTTTALTTEVADKGIVENYHQYVLTVPEGTYTYRGTDGDTNLGGMTFEVPFDEEILSDGTASGEGLSMTLRRMNYYTTNKAVTAVGDYTLRLVPGTLPDVVNGDQYIDASNRVVTPVLVMARGNAMTYQQMVTIHGELGSEYAVKPTANVTFNPGTSAMNKTFSLSAYVYHTITAPQTATVEMFNQINNFHVERVTDRTAAEPDSDGNVTYTYKTVGGSNLTYRVSQTGKITRAGFLGSSAEAVVVTFGENENPKATGHQLDNAAIQKRMEASTMLNANGQNDLRLTAGDTFRLRAYRGAWQIVNTDTMNIMIEPDFHYDVISGGEHIDIDVVDDVCTGNATGNWMDITGVSAGTAIVEVTYDAIQIGGEGTSYDGFYGATDPQRSSLLVIQVGAGERTLQMQAVGSENLWDTEYDTVYFLNDTGSMDFTATLGEEAPDKVELSTDKGATWTDVPAAEGVYTASGLIGGNNMLRFTKGDAVEYQVVRAAKVTQTITNLNRAEGIMAGDQLKIVYSGLYTPVAKFSGIYNPGFGQGHKVTYTVPEGYTVAQTGGQYDFISTNTYTVTVPEDALGDVTLTGGHIYFNVMGVADPLGGHRTLTDAGCGTNMSAVSTLHTRSILPDVTFTVSEMPYVDVTVAANVEHVQLTVKDSKGNALTPENGVYNLPLGTFAYVAALDGYITERGSFTVTLADAQVRTKTVALTMRKVEGAIWDGTTTAEPEQKDSVYQIGTGAELAWFASNHGNKNAVLTADISLGGFHWTPVTAYAGTFDGNGHWVTDLYLDSTANGQGLFAQLSSNGVIRNLGVRGVVTSTGRNVGGIMGVLRNKATVERCVSDVAVTGNQYVGGIAGQQYTSSVIQDCYNLGEITATKSYAGGISGGYASSVAFTIENCYSVGTITAPKSYGGLTWSTKAANGVNSYYVSGAADGGTATVGAVKTAAELQAMAQTLGEAWLSDQANVNGGYPILSWQLTEVPVTGLTLNKTSDELLVGGTLQLEVSFSPANATDTDVVWSSSNGAVASVENGVVTALAEGLATITVKTPDGAHSASCQVVVKGTDPLPTGPVTVYFSVSHDDNFVTGRDSDQTVALQQITVPYFDLELYGLQDYYFSSENYGDDGSGRPSSALEPGTAAYAKDKVTMLHLFIYATEIFYCGIDADKAGQGFLWKEGLLGGNAMTLTGSVGSSYITKFWGMDENFNYYLNYRYPLASKGWGSTSDQILLKDGDIVTVGHFTHYGFYTDPNSVFHFMVTDNGQTSVVQGDAVPLTVYRAGAQGGSGSNSANSAYETAHTVVTDEPEVFYVNMEDLSSDFADWNEAGAANEAGKITLDTTDWEPGTYLVAVAGQSGANTAEICTAPGGLLLTVAENPDKAAAEAVDTLIDAISAEDKAAIDTARAAYDALTDAQKAWVTKLAVLEAAELYWNTVHNKVSLVLTGADTVRAIDGETVYTLSAKGMNNLATVSITVAIPEEYLSAPAAAAADGWMIVAQVCQDGILHVVAANKAGANGDGDILTITAKVLEQAGTATVSVTSAEMGAYLGEDDETFVQADLTAASVSTVVEYNVFDVNKDGTVNLLDLTRAQRWYGTDFEDADVNGDDDVNINDLVLILNNYTDLFQ